MTPANILGGKGVLPQGWRWVSLGEVCDLNYGESLPANHRDSGGNVPVYGSNGIVGKHSHSKTSGPSIIVGRKGSIGEIHVSSTPCWPIDTTYYIDHTKIACHLPWLANCLKVLNLPALNKASAVPGLNRADVYSVFIPLPPLAEQKCIVSILDGQMAAIGKARLAAEARLAAASALPAAYLIAIFNPIESAAWSYKRLGDCALKGPDNGIFKQRFAFGKGVPIINVSDLYRSMDVNLGNAERVNVTNGELQRYSVTVGDLFFCRSSLKREGIGWCCYLKDLPEPAVFECHVMRIRVDTSIVLPEYVAYYWQHPRVREAVISNARTATMTTMNQEDLAAVSIPVAPIEVQRHIVDQLNEFSCSIFKLNRSLREEAEELSALPGVLLRKAFTGGV